MSDGDGLGVLARWSRRKAAAQAAAAQAAPSARGSAPPPAVEPLDLPAVETLDAASDYTVFLARGVSAAVQAKALRVAWASDPAIAEFRGMAEYAWDFNAPGYGALTAADDVGALLGQIIRSAARQVAAPPPRASEATGEAIAHTRAPVPTEPGAPLMLAEPPDAGRAVTLEPRPVAVAAVAETAQPAQGSSPAPVRRHGGAMPA